jgi:hypothetical protein
VLVRDYLNDTLADMGDYRGYIADIDLARWRGAYRTKELSIVKADGKVPVPLLHAPRSELAVSLEGALPGTRRGAQVQFEQARGNFIDGGADKQAAQTGQGTDWRAQLAKLPPITLIEVRINQAVVRFYNLTSSPS